VIKGSIKDRPATGQMLSIRQDKYRDAAAAATVKPFSLQPNISNLKFIFWPTAVTECVHRNTSLLFQLMHTTIKS
jgi:hypothetical protein